MNRLSNLRIRFILGWPDLRWLWIGVAISIGALVVRLALDDVVEPFRGVARIGEYLYYLAIAFLMNAFFYIFVNHLPLLRLRRDLYRIVMKDSDKICWEAEALVSGIVKASQHPSKDELTFTFPNWGISATDLKTACLTVTWDAPSELVVFTPEGFRHLSWQERLPNAVDQTRTRIDGILRFAQHLDSRHMYLLGKIEGCGMFLQLDYLRRAPLGHQSLETFSGQIWDYLSACRELHRYSIVHLHNYARDWLGET